MRPWVKFILRHVTFNKNGAVSELGFVRLAERLWPEANVMGDLADVLKLSRAA